MTHVMAVALMTLFVSPLAAQGGATQSPFRQAMREATRLDSDGRHAEARARFQKLIDSAATPADSCPFTRKKLGGG